MASSPTWPGLVDGWAAFLAASGQRPQTVRLRRHYVRSFVATLGDRPPRSVTLDDLTGFLAAPAWAPETRKSARQALRSLFAYLLAAGLVDVDPTAQLPTVPVPAGRPRPCPPDVLAAALARANGTARRGILLAAFAGLRRAEAAQLHADDVSPWGIRIDGKGGRVRVVPAHPIIERELSGATGYIFPVGDGHILPDGLGHAVRDALGGGYTMHTLRHTFATQVYAGCHDLRAVQELLGHSSPATTARYTAVTLDTLRSAVGLLGLPA